MGSSSPIFGVKIKNVWNHHLGDSGQMEEYFTNLDFPEIAGEFPS